METLTSTQKLLVAKRHYLLPNKLLSLLSKFNLSVFSFISHYKSKVQTFHSQGCKYLTGRCRSRCPVKHVFARTRPVFGRSHFNTSTYIYVYYWQRFRISRNSCVSEPKLHSYPTITKKQLNPSQFGNKNYKLTELPLFDFRTLQQMVRGLFSVQRDYYLWGCFPIILSIKHF